MAEITVFYDGPVVTREAAMASNQARYFTAKPCKQGHVAQRYAKCGKCTKCLRQRAAGWAKSNPDKISAYNKKYCKSEKGVSVRQSYSIANADKLKAIKRQRYQRNKVAIDKKNRLWAEQNREKSRAIKRKWAKANPENAIAKVHRRRARLLAASGSFTEEDITKIRSRQNNRCAICKDLLGEKFEVDHIIPLVKGGSNDRRNLQVTHPHCNKKKGSKDPIEFMREMGYLL